MNNIFMKLFQINYLKVNVIFSSLYLIYLFNIVQIIKYFFILLSLLCIMIKN